MRSPVLSIRTAVHSFFFYSQARVQQLHFTNGQPLRACFISLVMFFLLTRGCVLLFITKWPTLKKNMKHYSPPNKKHNIYMIYMQYNKKNMSYIKTKLLPLIFLKH